jgi:predicted RNase H-like HicB family nuclease
MTPYTIIIEKADGRNYAAYSPDVEGCGTTGATIEETLAMMKEALEFHFEGLAESGLEIPTPRGLVYHVTNATDENPLFHSPTDMVAFIDPDVLHWETTLEKLA